MHVHIRWSGDANAATWRAPPGTAWAPTSTTPQGTDPPPTCSTVQHYRQRNPGKPLLHNELQASTSGTLTGTRLFYELAKISANLCNWLSIKCLTVLYQWNSHLFQACSTGIAHNEAELCYTSGMAFDAGRTETLKHELQVLDSQRRGIVAELRRLADRRVNAGSVTDRVIAYLQRFGGPASTKVLLDFIVSERPGLNRRACAVTLYRAERRSQIVRQGRGWVLPETVVISRGS